MQVFVHIGGKNYGPYSVEQLRSFVKAGNFKEDQPACYDGKSWVRIRELPGFAVEPKPIKQEVKTRTVSKTLPKKTKKQRVKKLVIVCLSVAVALSVHRSFSHTECALAAGESRRPMCTSLPPPSTPPRLPHPWHV